MKKSDLLIRRRGVVLITTLFFMVLFAMLSVALYQLTPNDNRMTARDKTDAEAHFACTAAMRDARAWMGAVVAPSIANSTSIDYLGDTWGSPPGTVTAGSLSYARYNNDPFSVPATGHVFVQRSLADLDCPYNKFSGKTGADFLGLSPDSNLLSADYSYIKSEESNWLALETPQPLVVGDYEVYTYIVPSANTMDMAKGAIANGLRSYLITTVVYRDQEPILRARSLMKEQSASDYAYRNNTWGTDALGKPLTFRVSNATDVLFDGPVHTNEVPFFDVAAAYWDAAMVNGTKAINGSLTFTGALNTVLNATGLSMDAPVDADGVGWKGGNYQGGAATRRPYDDAGAPAVSSAGGGVVNRYDRLISGGRGSVRKVANVALPAELSVLRTAAFGQDSDTGLSSALNEVSPNQKDGSVQVVNVSRPSYRDSGGNLRGGPVVNRSDNGLFINPKSGGSEAAGGVVVKGNVRNAFLEITNTTAFASAANASSLNTDAAGRVTNVTLLESADPTVTPSIGNPTVRVQSDEICYDTNTFDTFGNYTSGPGAVVDPPYTDPPPYTPGGPLHSPVSSCPSPSVSGGGKGGGMGSVSYSCPHTKAVIDPPPTDPPPYTPTVWTHANNVSLPKEFRPQDWVTDVTNTDEVIRGASAAQPQAYDSSAFRAGQGTRIAPGDASGRQASSFNVTEIYVHHGNASNGTLLAAGATVSLAPSDKKIVLYKQSRSDANRLDVFLLDRPASQVTGLNGAVYATGDLSGLRGVNMARRTIGADYATDKGISIVDNIWQYGTVRGQKPVTAFQGLGLVGTRMNVQTLQSRFSLANPLYLYATIVAGKSGGTGGLDVSQSNSDAMVNWGRVATSTDSSAANRILTIVGGLTEQQAKARLVGDQGWSQSIFFDSQLAYNPPPFFPTTNLLQPMSYFEESVRRWR